MIINIYMLLEIPLVPNIVPSNEISKDQIRSNQGKVRLHSFTKPKSSSTVHINPSCPHSKQKPAEARKEWYEGYITSNAKQLGEGKKQKEEEEEPKN